MLRYLPLALVLNIVPTIIGVTNAEARTIVCKSAPVERLFYRDGITFVNQSFHGWLVASLDEESNGYIKTNALQFVWYSPDHAQLSYPAHKPLSNPEYEPYDPFGTHSSGVNCSSRDRTVPACRVTTSRRFQNFDIDSDSDGLYDEYETRFGLDPNDPADAHFDLDGDGLSNIEEWRACTYLSLSDSDEDGMGDAFEVQYDLKPYDNRDASEDPDGDGASNLEEFQNNTNPLVSDQTEEPDVFWAADPNDGYNTYSFEDDSHTTVLISEQGDEWQKSDKQPYRGNYSFYKEASENHQSKLRFFGNSNGGTLNLVHMLELFETEGYFRILLNGKEIHSLSETVHWQSFSYEIPEGDYVVSFEFSGPLSAAAEQAYVQIDDLQLPGNATVSAGTGTTQTENRFDFENGQIGKGWILGDENQWDLFATNTDTGHVSIGSAAIGDNQMSKLAYSGNFTSGTIEFDTRVNTQWNKDLLTFYIDGVAIKSWSGNRRWLNFEVEIVEGHHTLEWVYQKDLFLSSSRDRVWLDNIQLPLQ